MIRYRPIRRLLEEAMREEYRADNRDALTNYLAGRNITLVGIDRYYDQPDLRCGWAHTFIVIGRYGDSRESSPVGFSDAEG